MSVSRRDDLLIYISNLSDLFIAYGEECVWQAICDALRQRFDALGILAGNVSFVISSIGEHIAVGLAGVEETEPVDDDLFLERVKATLSRLPIECGPHRAFMNVFATLGVTGQFHEQLSLGLQGNRQPWNGARASLESASSKYAAYREDMATAAKFLEQMNAGMIVLAFQPVVVADPGQENIYSECLLRHVAVDGDKLASCEQGVLALERLGMIDRLDRSVLWAVIETLEANTSIRLGSNISALSLRHDCWWRLLQDYLADNPGVAERLTLEITETSAISQSDEAVNLLLSLRLMGCRICIDDMGAGYSTVNFLRKAHPNIVKIDRTFVTHSPGPGDVQAPHLLRHLIALCSDLSPCVIAEGVESEEELNAARDAGAHGVQGYFIERPTILPDWLSKPVTVQDSFAPGHRCLSMHSHDRAKEGF